MLKEAEITNSTSAVYFIDNLDSSIGPALGGTLNLVNPTFSWAATGEDTRTKPHTQPKISRGLLPYQLLSRTTGSELNDIQALLLLLVLLVVSNRVLTEYDATFQIEASVQTKFHRKAVDQSLPSDLNSASTQAERLREISGLKIERLAEIFGVSRTTYYKWMSGSPLHDIHREHLLEVLSLLEEASQRLGSPGATNTWLLTPVSPGEKKPIDYLTTQEYFIFRGFLLRVRTGREIFRPLAPSNRTYKERSPEEVESSLERLRPRAWRDDDISDLDDEEE